ncbi:MAG: sigma factor G inhibitor Gin [Bacillota bacterium]|nr:sigma factor G inhibitor Gin [Bacillota bacterium]
MEKRRCIICGRYLSDGIIINGRGICKSCEQRLVNLELNTDFYEFYKECIKRNVVQSIVGTVEQMNNI